MGYWNPETEKSRTVSYLGGIIIGLFHKLSGFYRVSLLFHVSLRVSLRTTGNLFLCNLIHLSDENRLFTCREKVLDRRSSSDLTLAGALCTNLFVYLLSDLFLSHNILMVTLFPAPPCL